MNHLDLHHFRAAVASGGQVVLDLNKEDPIPIKAKAEFNGKALSFLSNLPLLKQASFVKAYVEKVEYEDKVAYLRLSMRGLNDLIQKVEALTAIKVA
jgi:hypothetical protein